MTRNNEHTWGQRIAAGVLIAFGGTALTACAPSERPAATATADAPAPTPSESASQNPGEHIGQDTEIARDQLTIMDQKTSIEDMAAMSVDEFSKLSVADRAAYGYYLVHKILPENLRAYNVNTLDADDVSFYQDQANGIGSGNSILAAMTEQEKALVGSGLSADDGRKLLLSQMYAPLVGGQLPENTRNEMEAYAHDTQVDSIDVRPRVAVNESGWNKVGDQWVKAIECVIHSTTNDTRDRDQTVQFVRATVKLSDGTEVFWFMEGAAVNGNAVNDLATQPL